MLQTVPKHCFESVTRLSMRGLEGKKSTSRNFNPYVLSVFRQENEDHKHQELEIVRLINEMKRRGRTIGPQSVVCTAYLFYILLPPQLQVELKSSVEDAKVLEIRLKNTEIDDLHVSLTVNSMFIDTCDRLLGADSEKLQQVILGEVYFAKPFETNNRSARFSSLLAQELLHRARNLPPANTVF